MIIPKAGEFFVVSSDTLPSLNRKLMHQAIKESQANESSPPRPGKPVQYQPKTMMGGASLTDRKRKDHERNRSHNFTQQHNMPASTTHKLQAISGQQDGLTMSSLQGEITK